MRDLMLKGIEDIEIAIAMLQQDTDAAQRIKNSHLLKYEYRMALEKINSLEKTNKALRNELEKIPEYRQRQVVKSIGSYMDIFSSNSLVFQQTPETNEKDVNS